MKFKIIFILFNVVILFSFLIIFFMPLAMLGWDYTRDFWAGNWYLPLIFLGVMAVLNTYFLMNWKLFSLLEREEWGGIIGYVLERFKRGRIRRQEVRIGINAALVSSRIEVIGEIEQAIRHHKPGLLKEFALPLGVPRLLRNEPAEAESYYQEFLELESKDKPWIIWSYGFALLLQRKLEEAKVQFLALSSSKDPILLLLSAYMLDTCAVTDEEAKKTGQGMAEGLRSKYDRAALLKEAEKAKTQIHIVILSKVVDEALAWLYPADAVS